MNFLYPKYPPPPNSPIVIAPANGFESSLLFAVVLLVILFLLFVDVFIIALFSAFGDSFISIFIVLVFPLELVAVISTVPYFFAITSPVALTVAILSSLDYHVIFLSVASSGDIVAVNF